MEQENFEQIIDELLNNFYKRRIEKINTLKLKQALSRKNPYLYKATGYENAADIIKEILSAYMSSSDEGIFGDAFFEVLAEKVSRGNVAEAEGIDVIRQIDNIYQAIAVKSGTNVFNAASRKKQKENFLSLQSRIAKRGLVFQPIIGYGYGKKHLYGSGGVLEIAGQVFWEEMTGDPDFYIKIIRLIGDKPQKHLPEYQAAFNAAVNRFTREFTNDFCHEDGTINWEKLVDYNSGKPCKKIELNFNSNKTLSVDEEFQIKVTATLQDDTTEDVDTYDINGDFKDILLINDNGSVKFAPNIEPGTKVKIVISCYGKTATRTFTLKKERKKDQRQQIT
ncbi:TPA: PmeII family type II restriction endonuclease [Bacillus cereus]